MTTKRERPRRFDAQTRARWNTSGLYPKRPRSTMPRVDAEYVKAAITPLDFYRRELPSMPEPRHPGGWVSGGLCVFHLDRHPKNFRINMDSGAFTCFSCGAAGGDVIAFMMQHYGLSFHDALRRLANEWRIS